MAEYRERPKTSVAWDHFTIQDREMCLAQCNLCHDSYSYRTSVSNLTKHLRVKHNLITANNVDECEEDGDREKSETKDKRKILKSEVWEYFEVKDPEAKTAICNLCSEEYSYRSTTGNLTRHLKRIHSIDFAKDSRSDCEEEDGLDTSDITDKRNGKFWKYFDVKESESKIAICNLCSDELDYQSTTANLKGHLRQKHSIDFDEETRSDYDGEDEPDKPEMRKRSEMWEYFEVKDPESKMAMCHLCSEEFSYRSTTANLTRHLRRKHRIDLKENKEDDLDKSLPSHSRYRYSLAWEHFTITDANKRIASCNLCGTNCSFRSSVSNLMKHARRKHNIGVKYTVDDSGAEDDAGPPRRAHRSIVWLYFRQIDSENKVSQCVICKKMLSHSSSVTNLRKHLLRKHPDVMIPEKEDGKKRILVSSGGELFELDTQNDNDEDIENQTDSLAMDTVYLEDLEALEQEPAPKKIKLSPKFDDSSSEDEITLHSKKYVKKQQDSLDYFGKYLTSLLKQLPKEISNQLQTDFIKQAISAQSCDARKETYEVVKVTDTDNAYSITVTDAQANIMDFDGEVVSEK